MSDTDSDRRARDLAAFTNAAAQPHQPTGGHALVRPTSGLAERVIGAQPVAVYRDEAKILQKLKALAAAAGSDWFYRFPVRKREGGQDWIEGPSIKLANDVARIFGNNINEVRELDVGDAWVFYARFTDIETGFTMERAYRQRKSQTSMRMRDADRQLDIAYQIGQSKAIRNCICNALQVYADYAFEEARNSLVEKIGKDLPNWRERTLQGLRNIPVDIVRVERIIGRPAREWLAPHIAQVVAMMKSIFDGMASVDEVFPPIEQEASGASTPEAGASDQDDGAQAGDTSAKPAAAPAAAEPAAAPAAAAEAPAADDALAIAYRRGQEQKTAGHTRKAVPVEYRDPLRQREAVSWLAGWDGAPMPAFTG
jgi:hypothetical protein